MKKLKKLLNLDPHEISEEFKDDLYRLKYEENGESIGIATTDKHRLYYIKNDESGVIRTIYVWNNENWEIESLKEKKYKHGI